MRRIFTALHRAIGLSIALFLFVAGLTGAVIAWNHELDAWLNPELFHAEGTEPNDLDALRLADDLEKRSPNLRVTYLPLDAPRGSSLVVFVEPRPDSNGHKQELGFDQVALHPTTGAVLGARKWGEVSLRRKSVIPFLYKLHYTLHLPGTYGPLFTGTVAIVWAFDCVIALVIAFPKARTWKRSFAFRWRRGGIPLVFDLHRSGGVWVWFLLLVLAVSSVSLNLGKQVMRPLVGLVSTLAPNPFDRRPSVTPETEPGAARATIVEAARAEGLRRGFKAPPGAVRYSSASHVYGVGFYTPDDDLGTGLGAPWLYFDAADGSPRGERVPGGGSSGDVFLQLQFPLHSGRVFGTAGRVAISATGLVVAMLSATGVMLWLNRRRARRLDRSDEARTRA